VKNNIISLLIVSFFISSCAHSYSIYSNESKLQFYDRVNKKSIGKECIYLTKKDGDKIKVNTFTLAPDSTIYSKFELGTADYINTDELSQIEFGNNSKLGSFILGIGVGTIATIPAVAIMSAAGFGVWQLFILPSIGSIIGTSIGLSSGPDIIKLQ